MSFEEVVFKRSYLNIAMLNAAIETEGGEIKADGGKAKQVHANEVFEKFF